MDAAAPCRSSAGDGLCYPHATPCTAAFVPPITRELITPCGTLVPDAKIHRVLAKLPIAVADGLFSPTEAAPHASLQPHARLQPPISYEALYKPIADDYNFLSSCLPTLMTALPAPG